VLAAISYLLALIYLQASLFVDDDQQNVEQRRATAGPLQQESVSNKRQPEVKETGQSFPVWKGGAIDIKPILKHIDQYFFGDELYMLRGVDDNMPGIGELFYIVDPGGIWSSTPSKNNKRDPYRVQPTERLLDLVLATLLRNDEQGNNKWGALRQNFFSNNSSSAGFPYFAWYGDWKGCCFHNYPSRSRTAFSVPLFTTCARAMGCQHSFPTPACE